MKTAKAGVAQRATEEAPVTQEVGIRFQSEMVIREDTIIPFDDKGDGRTLGELLDGMLMDLAHHGGEPRSYTFSFDPKSWEQARPLYKQKYDEKQEEYRRY